MQTTSVFFNNFDLNTIEGVRVYDYNVDEMPKRELNASKLARANRSLLTSAEYVDKQVQVFAFVGNEDAYETQRRLNLLKARIQDVEGIIRVKQGDADVEYVGTLNEIEKKRVGKNLKVTLTFECSNPIGRDASGSVLFAPVTITTSTYNQLMNVDGSFEAKPRFTITINSGTGLTNKNISLINAATGKGIKINRTFTAGDIISINSDTMEVLVNSAAVDIIGQFPVFLPGSRTLQYIDDFTTRNVTLSAIYTRQYA